ncbi:MAG TPA: acetoin utilization protein AcuC [Nitrososphaeraceae archaeon]
MNMCCSTVVLFGEELAKYGFGESHPMSSDRIYAFWSRFQTENLDKSDQIVIEGPSLADEKVILTFHDANYIDLVKKASKHGIGFLDSGDTPSFKGVFEASSYVVGSTLKALDLVIRKKDGVEHAFNPIGGLHHAKRNSASGFCVFNDIGIAIMEAREKYDIKRIVYVDIDAHHGDGVYYEFEDDPFLFFADIHEDGRFLYPGTGSELETGLGNAEGTKLNIPIAPNSTDDDFISAFNKVEKFINDIAKPELIILQCGADSLNGDPITHLRYTANAHRYAADSLHRLAHYHCNGRIVALGGGGYNRANIADAWTTIVKSFVKTTMT